MIGELCTWFDKLEFFFCFPLIEELYPPVCFTGPASLQADLAESSIHVLYFLRHAA